MLHFPSRGSLFQPRAESSWIYLMYSSLQVDTAGMALDEYTGTALAATSMEHLQGNESILCTQCCTVDPGFAWAVTDKPVRLQTREPGM